MFYIHPAYARVSARLWPTFASSMTPQDSNSMASAVLLGHSQHSSSIRSIIPLNISLKTKKIRGKISIFDNPKEFAAEFAHAVTVPSTNESDWVARNGNESLFRTLQHIIPEVGYFIPFRPALSVCAMKCDEESVYTSSFHPRTHVRSVTDCSTRKRASSAEREDNQLGV
jgi:hypothetical protein